MEETTNKKESVVKYVITIAIIVVLIIVAVVVLPMILSDNTTATATENNNKIKTPVYINEIMTNNKSNPDIRGEICDWIELYNKSDYDIDISGYVICDEEKTKKLVLPEGTVIPSDGYFLISFGDGEGDYVAPFKLSRKGNETVILSDANDNVIDAVAIEALNTDCVMARDKKGNWQIVTVATPMFENDSDKYIDYLNSLDSIDSPIMITEAVSSNLGLIKDVFSENSDWLEITNISQEQVSLLGYFVSDDEENLLKFALPNKTLMPNESIIIFANGKDDTANNCANFKISRDGETLYLSDWHNVMYQSVDVPKMEKNYSYALMEDGVFHITKMQTPEKPNTYEYDTAQEYEGLIISEVCPSNRSGIVDEDNDFSDWIEIANNSTHTMDLSDLWLSKDEDSVFENNLDGITLDAGERVVIFASNKNKTGVNYHAGFSLSRYGETILLHATDGSLIDSFIYADANDDRSYIHGEKLADTMQADYITPGYEDNLNGHVERMKSIETPKTLIINEVMTSNSKYLPVAFGANYDWVEIYNNSDENINLSDYMLTDDIAHPDICVLPDITLRPNEYFVVICSGDNSKTNAEFFFADFVLSSEYSAIYLLDKDENLVDCLTLYDIPPDASYGRLKDTNGYYYFVKPSPNEENTNGAYGVSKEPETSIKDGVYQTDNGTLTVELSARGNIYYTLDGTKPTIHSKMYTQPIELTETTVIRTLAVEPDMLSSQVCSYTYLLDVEHNLPILSLSVNPKDMFDEDIGIYVEGNAPGGNYYMDWEKEANITFYDTDGGGFSIDCGLKMHGGGSRRSDTKKSLKVNFRGKYGEDSLVYDLFDETTPNEFTSLVIRAGEDYRYTVFRSELLLDLAREANPNALTQTHKYCVLYVNGEYFGIFALMERFNEEYYAARYNVSPESVTIVSQSGYEESELYDLVEYCKENDITKDETYEYVCSRVDIDNLIDFCIFQAYCGNTDISNNVRFMKSSEGDGKWRYCLYDFDWTMRIKQPTFGVAFKRINTTFSLPRQLIKNVQFQERVLARVLELKDGVLSDEHVLSKIDEYYKLLESELPKDRDRWNNTMEVYEDRLDEWRSVLLDNDRWGSLMQSLAVYVVSLQTP